MTHARDPEPIGKATEETEAAILAAVRGLRYGSIEITVHDSVVVQIERKEKIRFGAPSTKARC